jgi:hypothetical protein
MRNALTASPVGNILSMVSVMDLARLASAFTGLSTDLHYHIAH